jgi:hypothetical protein
MRPLKGVVIRCDRQKGEMKIKLQSGNVITTIADKDIGRGDCVWVFYDFTRNRVQDICLFGQINEPEPDEPDETEEPFIPEGELEEFEEGAFSLPSCGEDGEASGLEIYYGPDGPNETLLSEKEESTWEIEVAQSHICLE